MLVAAVAPDMAEAQVVSRVSVASDGTPGNDDSKCPGLSADGQIVAFASKASNLVGVDDGNAIEDVFVRDRQTGTTTRLSLGPGSAPGNSYSGLQDCPAPTPDGRFVAFESEASDLVPADTNDRPDVFVHDRQAGTTTRVSIASDGTQGNGGSRSPALSAGGRFVAFTSFASSLVAGDTNGASDIFVHDRQTETTAAITRGNNASACPSLSADGRLVAFLSLASDLVPGETNGFTPDVFVHDRQTGTTTRVSVASDGTQGNGSTHCPAISADGRVVAFASDASNLVPDDTNSVTDVFVHDRQTGVTTRVSVASDGSQGNRASGGAVPFGSRVVATGRVTVSADGRLVAFASAASNLVPGDTNGVTDVFVHDRQAGRTIRASVAPGGVEGNGHSVDPALSADGGFVAFASEASNLVPGDVNEKSDVFVARVTFASLTISPPSGSYVSTQGFDLVLIERTDGAPVVERRATLNGVDVSGGLAGCIIPGILLVGGTTSRCPGLTGGLFGPGTHVLGATLLLGDGASVTETVTWQVPPAATVPSLAISPPSGSYVTTQRFDLVLTVGAGGFGIVGGTAVLDGVDVTGALAGCVVPGTLPAGGVTLRCPGLAGGLLGPGRHVLAVTLTLGGGVVVGGTVSWEILANAEP